MELLTGGSIGPIGATATVEPWRRWWPSWHRLRGRFDGADLGWCIAISKPANLFWPRVDSREVPLLDFGVAALLASNKDGGPGPGMLIGTPQYMARAWSLMPHGSITAICMRLGGGLRSADRNPALWRLRVLGIWSSERRAQTRHSRQLRRGFRRWTGCNRAFERRWPQPAQPFQSARELAIALSALEESGGEASRDSHRGDR